MTEPFVFDLSRTGWRPKSLDDLTAELCYALEQQVGPDDVEFAGSELGAAADAPREILDSDESVKGFCSSGDGSVSGGQVALRKLIRVELPYRISTNLRRPRALALLATGRQLSKFAGQLEGGGAEFSLRLFDCGHFRIKETAPGTAGFSVWEGRWEETATSVKLQLHLNSQEQQRARRRSGDGADILNMVPPELRFAELEVSGGGDDSSEEARLHGELPTLFGSSPTGRVELRLDAMESRPGAATGDLRMQVRQGRSAADGSDDDAEYRQILRDAARRPLPAPPPKKREWEDDFDSDEPRWPMYLGIVLFIVIIVAFAWALYEDWYGEEPTKEFDEL